jgi:hypothetical protein
MALLNVSGGQLFPEQSPLAPACSRRSDPFALGGDRTEKTWFEKATSLKVGTD